MSWRKLPSFRLKMIESFPSLICFAILLNRAGFVEEKKLCYIEYTCGNTEFCREYMECGSSPGGILNSPLLAQSSNPWVLLAESTLLQTFEPDLCLIITQFIDASFPHYNNPRVMVLFVRTFKQSQTCCIGVFGRCSSFYDYGIQRTNYEIMFPWKNFSSKSFPRKAVSFLSSTRSFIQKHVILY